MTEPLQADTAPVAIYSNNFLAPTKTFVYHQVVGLSRYRPVVLTDERINDDLFPYDPVFCSEILRSFSRRKRYDFARGPGRRALRVFTRDALAAWLPRSRRYALQVLPNRIFVPLALLAIWREARRGSRTLPLPLRSLYFESVLLETGARLLHAQFGTGGLVVAGNARSLGLPFVTQFHGADASRALADPVYRSRLAGLFRSCDLVLTVNDEMQPRLVEAGCPEEKLLTHHVGIPSSRFSDSTSPGDRSGTGRIVQIAGFVEKKGQRDAILAFAKIAPSLPHARLAFIGDGPCLAECRRLVGELGLEDRVEFLGRIPWDRVAAELARSAAFVHPSTTAPDGDKEGIPTSLLEAMAAGLPVVATRHGGIGEAVEDGVNGFLIAERNTEAIAECLKRCLENPDRASSMGAKARETVRAHFDQEVQNKRLEAIYDRLIRSAEARAGQIGGARPSPEPVATKPL